jgi:hypothetical protein
VDAVTDGGPNGRRAAFLERCPNCSSAGIQEASAAWALASGMAGCGRGQQSGHRPAPAPGPGPRPTDLFREATTLDPEDADLFFNLGYAHWIAREYPQAVAGAA